MILHIFDRLLDDSSYISDGIKIQHRQNVGEISLQVQHGNHIFLRRNTLEAGLLVSMYPSWRPTGDAAKQLRKTHNVVSEMTRMERCFDFLVFDVNVAAFL